jgi:hypothetical protein
MRHHHLDISELHQDAFRKNALGKVKLYGKGDSPPAPDYEAQAKAEAAGNLEAMRVATKANRVNQYTPWGSLEYYNPTGTLNKSAYDAAMANYNRALQQANSGQSAPTGSQNVIRYTDDKTDKVAWRTDGPITGADGKPLVMPKESDFMQGYDPDAWAQRVTLAPEAQAALDQQLALNRKYGEVANIGFDRVRGIFERPELDLSQLPERAIGVGQTAQQAIMSRLQPQLAQQEEQLAARLANQGIGLGSDAYGNSMRYQNQRRNDLELQAALQGIALDQQNRASALQEQAYIQDRPLNLINALRSGNQVNMPQFQQFALQQATQGPDYMGAADKQYAANIEQANAQAAQGSGLGSVIGGLGGFFLGGPAGAAVGSQVGSGLFSDERLKTDIKKIGEHEELGVGIYSYKYKWGGPTMIGVMAQELEKVKPEAVFEVDGFKAVDYGRL